MKKCLCSTYPLISFFVLSYACSWLFWIPLAFVTHIDQDLITIIMLIGVLGPFVAALIVGKKTHTLKRFWKQTLLWKVSPKLYVITLILPVCILFLLLIVQRVFGVLLPIDSAIESVEKDPWFFYPLVLLFMIVIGGGMEEPGWRGFAQPRLLAKFSPFTTSIILGIIWTYWHTPLMFVPGSSQQGIELGWYTLGVTSLAIILTWLYKMSNGSAFLAILFHGGVNAITNYIDPYTITLAGITLTDFAIMELLWALTAMIIVLSNRQWFFSKTEDPLLIIT